ncbi:hypothetical protein ACFSGJ_03860 [Halodurantibacterium flavum]|uniref:Uncharacterized protein n=2 Tax=Halodurantibacterium flavum TaxID=1382802 RepID=A0ABW4S2R0_9RHOB
MTIYDTALRNFEAAAAILTSLQAGRINLAEEAVDALVGKPKLLLAEGYNDIGKSFGVCLPGGKKAELIPQEGETGLDLRAGSSMTWMTLEGAIPAQSTATQCYLEIEAEGESSIVADVFVRELTPGGAVDGPLNEWRIPSDGMTVFRLAMPESSEGTTNPRRIIVHLRQPPRRIILRRLAMTLF